MQPRYAQRAGTALRLFLCLGLLSQAGCKKKDSAPENKDSPAEKTDSPAERTGSPSQERPSLLVPGEIEEMRKIFTAIAAENAGKNCNRPVLRSGPAVEGRADEDMLALLDTEGAAEDFIAPHATTPATREAFVAHALASDPVRVDWRERQQWSELDAARIKTPTLLVHGELDPYAPIERQSAFFARIASPDKQWVILPGGDHAAHLETTGPQFVHAVVAFLGRQSAK